MNVLAICDRRYQRSAGRVAGLQPITCPPRLTRDILWPNWLLSDLVYIDLHGDPDEGEWLLADGERVLHVRELEGLPPRVVFATTCHMPQTAFYDVLRRGSILICGDGENFGLRDRAIGAPLLALWFRRFYDRTGDVVQSLRLAKARVALTAWRRSDRDALQFYIAPPPGGSEGDKHV